MSDSHSKQITSGFEEQKKSLPSGGQNGIFFKHLNYKQGIQGQEPTITCGEQNQKSLKKTISC